MVQLIKKYKAFIIGPVITLILGVILAKIGFIIIDDDIWKGEVLFFFVLWSAIISLPIYKFNYLKRYKTTVFKILGLVVLLVLTVLYDSFIKMPDNPLTIILITIFWIGVFYIIFPKFIYKYRFPLIGVYTIILGYFTYIRLASGSFEEYVSNSKEGAIMALVIPVPIFVLLLVYEQWKSVKELKTEKTRAELELLKNQINPHFFFNTLNNLYSLTVKESKEAPQVVLKLSEMMRYTIYEGKKDFVPLADEVEYLNNYIELHKIRYKKTVNISFIHEVDENVEVAPLLFIVPLENAIKHGVETLSDNAYVAIRLKSDGKSIQFSIENNFDPREIAGETGIGLENLKRRLGLIYPKKHDLQIMEKGHVFKLLLTIQL